MMSGEEKIREEIRRRLKEKMESKRAEAKKARTFKLTGTDADRKLDMPASVPKVNPVDQEASQSNAGPQEDIRQKLFDKKPQYKQRHASTSRKEVKTSLKETPKQK